MTMQRGGSRGLATIFILSLAAVVNGRAQQPMRDSLQTRVVQRFIQNYRQMAGLSDDQFAKLREATRQTFQERAQLERRERDVWMALESQMRPGVAANPDSVMRLLDALTQIQAARVAQFKQEQVRYAAFLTPVQRALLTIQFQRLQQQIERIRQQRRGMMPPGMPPA